VTPLGTWKAKGCSVVLFPLGGRKKSSSRGKKNHKKAQGKMRLSGDGEWLLYTGNPSDRDFSSACKGKGRRKIEACEITKYLRK